MMSHTRRAGLGASLVFLFVLGLTLPARAQLGPALAGRTAAAQNAATVNQNPAGIMRLSEFEVVVDGILAISDNKFEVKAGTTESGGNPDNDVSVAAIPQLAISTPLGELFEGGDRFAVGLGFAVPTGFGSDYGNDWAGRYLAQESSLIILNIQPVVAARVTDWLSIGAGAAIMYTDSSTKVAVNNGPGLDDGQMKLDLDGWSAGPVLSVLLEPSERLRFGAVWRGEVEPELEGRANFSDLSPAREMMLEDLGLIDAKVDLGMRSPQVVQVGGYYDVTPKLALMGDVTWIDWSRFGTVDIAVSDFSTTSKTNYKDVWIGSVGAEYRFNERWKGALGFTYISSAISDSNRTLAFPLDELFITGIGATFELNEEVELHGNFLLALGGDGAVDQGSGLTGRLVGEFERRQTFAFQVSAVWRP